MNSCLRRVSLSGFAGVAMLVAMPFASAPPAATSPDVVPVASRKPAPAISLRDAAGKKQQLSDYRGRVVLLDFWATWCTGCKPEIPWFIEFDKKYRSEGLSAIGVSVDGEGWRTVKAYLAEHPIIYPIVLGDIDLMQKRFGLPASLPVTLLIDRQGRIAQTHPGVVDQNQFEADIRQLLAEPTR